MDIRRAKLGDPLCRRLACGDRESLLLILGGEPSIGACRTLTSCLNVSPPWTVHDIVSASLGGSTPIVRKALPPRKLLPPFLSFVDMWGVDRHLARSLVAGSPSLARHMAEPRRPGD